MKNQLKSNKLTTLSTTGVKILAVAELLATSVMNVTKDKNMNAMADLGINPKLPFNVHPSQDDKPLR